MDRILLEPVGCSRAMSSAHVNLMQGMAPNFGGMTVGVKPTLFFAKSHGFSVFIHVRPFLLFRSLFISKFCPKTFTVFSFVIIYWIVFEFAFGEIWQMALIKFVGNVNKKTRIFSHQFYCCFVSCSNGFHLRRGGAHRQDGRSGLPLSRIGGVSQQPPDGSELTPFITPCNAQVWRQPWMRRPGSAACLTIFLRRKMHRCPALLVVVQRCL